MRAPQESMRVRFLRCGILGRISTCPGRQIAESACTRCQASDSRPDKAVDGGRTAIMFCCVACVRVFERAHAVTGVSSRRKDC
jgi:hypothetical protein